MKQLIQHLRTGETQLLEVPAPALPAGHILVKNTCSVISTGTEKMLVEFSRGNLISKVRQQPERVAQVLDKMRTEGILPTLEAVFNKLDEPIPLGYSSAGVVVAVASDVHTFRVGDRVITNGPHTEMHVSPVNLAARIPDAVDMESAAFTVIASVGMQAIRLAEPQIGDTTVVIGLGLIGLITCQLLRAQGSRVIAYDIDASKCTMAETLGIQAINSSPDDLLSTIRSATQTLGADQVIICASAKQDNLIDLAARSVRKRGRVILTGVVNTTFDRTPFYEKEITLQVSGSYGPGRYDPQYEQQGIDYPAAYVRYTAKRNFESVLYALSTGSLQVQPLITDKIQFHDAPAWYMQMGTAETIAAVIRYSEEIETERTIHIDHRSPAKDTPIAAIIGAGNFTRMTLLPALADSRLQIKYMVSHNGTDATLLARKFKIGIATTDIAGMMNDPSVDLVMIATRHDSHASLAIEALQHGKHVYLEKPMAIHPEELETLERAVKQSNRLFFTGYNRRFAPFSIQAKEHIHEPAGLQMTFVVNAGQLSAGHWLSDTHIGGGRIIGEACHWFDLMQFFAGSQIATVYATDNSQGPDNENAMIHLRFRNGAQGTLLYTADGAKSYPKELLTLIQGGKVIRIDNFRKLEVFSKQGNTTRSAKMDKGHGAQFSRLADILRQGGQAPIAFEHLINSSKATFATLESIRTGNPVNL